MPLPCHGLECGAHRREVSIVVFHGGSAAGGERALCAGLEGTLDAVSITGIVGS